MVPNFSKETIEIVERLEVLKIPYLFLNIDIKLKINISDVKRINIFNFVTYEMTVTVTSYILKSAFKCFIFNNSSTTLKVLLTQNFVSSCLMRTLCVFEV